MKQNIIKIICFLAAFVIALNIISAILNKGNTDLTVEMSGASLPTVTMRVEGQNANYLHGYSGEMQASYLRDTLTPLSENRKLSVLINTFGTEISGISYEVRSLDTTRLVENTQVYDYLNQSGAITAEFNIKDLIDPDTEYILTTILQMADGREIRYYTRIVQPTNFHASEQMAFVLNFHQKTFDKDKAKELVTYLESNEQGDNSTLNKVNIHSSFQQVTWGDLKVSQIGDAKLRILEMDAQTASMLVDFRVAAADGNSKENYLVREFFRIRYTPDRIYLLEYEREMKQLFDPLQDVFVNDKIMMGITNENVEFAENTDGSIVVFEQQNALYAYRNSDGKMARLFSFYDENNMDERTLYDQHGIKILSVDEAGNVRFMVYGYMNRGRHEGNVGISIYYYDDSMNAIEEEVYIPYQKSYGLLKENLSLLSYINRKNDLYIYLDETIYCIHLEDNSYTEVVSGLTEGNLVVSKSNQMIAWQSERENQKVNLMDLNTGKIRQPETDSNNRIHSLGFVGEDFVYGISNQNDIVRDAAGVTMIPMHTLYIEDNKGNILKTYHQDSIYVTSVTINGNTIQMKRITKSVEDGTYTQTSDDQIMNNLQEEQTKNSITTIIIEKKEKVVEIALMNNIPTQSIQLLTPKEVLFEGGRNLNFVEKEGSDRLYYVYAKGEICGIYNKPYEAVNKASQVAGVVVNKEQQYIWQKGNRAQRIQIDRIEAEAQSEEKTSLAVCLDQILLYEDSPRNCEYLLQKGETALSLLRDNIRGEVLDLSGCELDTVLYYISQKIPVLAGVGGDRSVLIIGYDEKNTIIMDPESGTIYKKGMNDSKEWFKTYGNEFITYVKTE